MEEEFRSSLVVVESLPTAAGNPIPKFNSRLSRSAFRNSQSELPTCEFGKVRWKKKELVPGSFSCKKEIPHIL